MPFVPLRARKAVPLVEDADKEVIRAKQQQRDLATIQAHLGTQHGSTGYRFANHPATFGYVRGPDVPFRNATSTWRPPSAERDGPAQQRDRQHADHGALLEGSHKLRQTRSSPSLQASTVNMREACHPLSTELKRWETLANRTQGREMKDIEQAAPRAERSSPPPKIGANRQGLVLFPKYMLINNCHLKQQDLQRFQREQAEEAARAAQEALDSDLEGGGQLSPGSPGQSLTGEEKPARSGPVKFEASWGAPKLKTESVGGPHYAGSGMPAGRGMRTSNPFRMG